jgi:hypothetical protein
MRDLGFKICLAIIVLMIFVGIVGEIFLSLRTNSNVKENENNINKNTQALCLLEKTESKSFKSLNCSIILKPNG